MSSDTLAKPFAVNSVVRDEAFQWAVVGAYFTSTAVLRGLWLTQGVWPFSARGCRHRTYQVTNRVRALPRAGAAR